VLKQPLGAVGGIAGPTYGSGLRHSLPQTRSRLFLAASWQRRAVANQHVHILRYLCAQRDESTTKLAHSEAVEIVADIRSTVAPNCTMRRYAIGGALESEYCGKRHASLFEILQLSS
jgi:hypothetical protein